MFDDTIRSFRGYGARLKAAVRRSFGSLIRLSAGGEMIPNRECYCEIDSRTTDRWGIPVLRFHFKWGKAELAMAEHMSMVLDAMIDRLGGRVLSGPSAPAVPLTPGLAFHEVGVARMGSDPARSVVDGHGRSHDIPNLFIVDGAVFASHPEKNPTHTIMAIAWRASEHLLALASRRELRTRVARYSTAASNARI
jgi:choline dehydrogenase-like flavoprotein